MRCDFTFVFLHILAGPSVVDVIYPDLMRAILAEHLEGHVDMQAVSRTCRGMHAITSSVELEAAWLWRWRGDHALFHRRSRSSLAVMRLLVQVHHVDAASARSPDGASILHLTCMDDYTEAVEYLFTQPNIDVNLAIMDSHTPLHFACLSGGIRATHQLLAQPHIDVNAVNSRGNTGLFVACAERHADAVGALLAHPNVDVNIVNGDGASPLVSAICNGFADIVALLCMHPATRVNEITAESGISPLILALVVPSHDIRVVRELLLHPGIQVNAALAIACRFGNLPVILELLAHPGLGEGVIRAAVVEAELPGHHADVLALLRGHRAVRRALRG